MAMARPSAAKANLPTIGSSPCARACSSESPTVATSGSVKMAPGMATQSRTDFLPAIDLGGDLPLLRGLVGQERRAGEVADGEDRRDDGAAAGRPPARSPAASSFTPAVVEPEPLGVGPEAHRHQDLVGRDRLLLPVHLDLDRQRAARGARSPFALAFTWTVDARAAAAPSGRAAPPPGRRRSGCAGSASTTVTLRAQLGVDGPELQPDDPAADDDQPPRAPPGRSSASRALQTSLPSKAKPGDGDGARAGGEDEGRRPRRGSSRRRPRPRPRSGPTKRGRALQHLHAVPLLERADARRPASSPRRP